MPWSTSDRRSEMPQGWRTRYVPRILRRDRYQCQLGYDACTGRATQVDHRVPGMDHSDENLQAVCATCHGLKSSREGHEAKAKLRALRKRPPENHPGRRRDRD